MGNVFISYRRDDAAGYARAIYEELTERFSPERVFMDVDAIEPGLPFDEVIRDAVGQCEVLLVLIGARWLAPRPEGGTRLDDERDFVRIEIAAALARKIRVIPVLLDGTPMPKEAELPEPLRGLAWRNAIELSNTRFNADVNRLVEVLAKVLGEAARPAPVAGAPAAAASASAARASPAPSPPPPAAAQAEPPSRAAAHPTGSRTRLAVIGGAVVLVLAAALVALWPAPPAVDPSAASNANMPNVPGAKMPKVTSGNMPPSAPALPAYGVVFGSDRTLAAARDEIDRAAAQGVKDAGVYFRNGYFASIAAAASQTEADRILGIVRAFGTDPYAVRMETWCRQPQARDGYVECAATATKQ